MHAIAPQPVTTAGRCVYRGWLHAAQSYFHDVEPCVARGLPVLWVNRRGESTPRGARPFAEVPNLEALAQWLGA